MKKTLSIFVLGLILFSFSMSFVSAATGPVEVVQGLVSGAYELVRPILEGIIGSADTAEFFLAKVMFLIVIFAIIYKVLENIPFFNNVSWVLWLVSAAVSILSIRWFGDAEIIRAAILPYSALGVAITAGLPFVIWFSMVEFSMEGSANTIRRKISWIFFIVVFVALWITRAGKAVAGGPIGGFAYIYLVTAGLGLAVLMFDGTIQGIMRKAKIERIHGVHKSKLAEQIEDEMEDRRERYSKKGKNYQSIHGNKSGLDAYKEDIKELEDRLNALSK